MCFDNCGVGRIVSTRGPVGATGSTGATGSVGATGATGAAASFSNATVADYGTGAGPTLAAGYDVVITNSAVSGTTISYFGTIFVEATDVNFVSATPKVNGIADTTKITQDTYPTAVAGKTYVTMFVAGKYNLAVGQSMKITVTSAAANARLRDFNINYLSA